jgi:hypothetical protein
MPWRAITVDDVTQDLTPAENLALRSAQNSTSRLGIKLQDTVLKFIGAMNAARYETVADGTVPDQLREHILALAVWNWLRGFPQLKAIKTKEREEAAKEAEKVYEQIVKRTYGDLEDPDGTDLSTGNWNSENKLIMRTHPIPRPSVQFPPFLSTTTNGRIAPDFGDALVFAGPAGTLPPFPVTRQGQEAINETVNEEWFVNSSNQWQQTQSV